MSYDICWNFFMKYVVKKYLREFFFTSEALKKFLYTLFPMKTGRISVAITA
jgi:hypothetical protein